MSEEQPPAPISPLGPNRAPTVANWAEQYKELNKHRWSWGHLQGIDNELRRLAMFVGTKEFTPQVLAEFQAATHERKAKPWTIHRTFREVRQFVLWLEAMEFVDYRRFTSVIRVPPPPKVAAKIFTETQYERLKAAAKGTYWYYAVIMAYRTGARYSDVALLKWESVHLDECYLRYLPFKTRKHGKEAVCPFNVGGDLHEVLLEMSLCKGANPKGWEAYVCPDMAMTYPINGGQFGAGPQKRFAFKQLCEKNGCAGLSFHKLRNSFMSRLVQSGASYPMASQITGLASASVFNQYAKPDVESLRKVMDRMDKKDDPPEGTIIKLPGAA